MSQFVSPKVDTDPYAGEPEARYRVDIVLIDIAWGGRRARKLAHKSELFETEKEALKEVGTIVEEIYSGELVFPEGAYEIEIVEGGYQSGSDCGDGSFDAEFCPQTSQRVKRFRVMKRISVEFEPC
jgi:hypothetical protein